MCIRLHQPLSLLSHPGEVVEMHGNIRQMVCVECHQVQPLTAALLRRLKAKQHIACPASPEHPPMRCRIMLYDDAEGGTVLHSVILGPRQCARLKCSRVDVGCLNSHLTGMMLTLRMTGLIHLPPSCR